MNENGHPFPDIVKTIKDRHITPTSKRFLIAKNVAFWFLLIVCSITGALFLSLALLDIFDIGPDLFRESGVRHLPFLLFRATPLVWVLFFTLSVASGALAFQSTKHGYRYHRIFVVSLFVLCALTLALLAHSMHIAERMERTIENHLPQRAHPFLPPRESRWSSPQEGSIAGRLISRPEMGSFRLETPRKENWIVHISPDTRVGRRVRLEPGEYVLIFGEARDTENFSANFIRPLRGRGERNGNIR